MTNLMPSYLQSKEMSFLEAVAWVMAQPAPLKGIGGLTKQQYNRKKKRKKRRR